MVLLRAKCLILGDQAVGKTALAQSFYSDGTTYPNEYTMTTGVEYLVKPLTLRDTQDIVEFHLLESGGAHEFREFAQKMVSLHNVAAIGFFFGFFFLL